MQWKIRIKDIAEMAEYLPVYNKIAQLDADAVIIGTTFKEESVRLAHQLEEKEFPYILVDSMVENTSPLAYFTSDHYICGYLVAKLITTIIPPNADIGMLN